MEPTGRTAASVRETAVTLLQRLLCACLLALPLSRTAVACVVDPDCNSLDPCQVNNRCVNGICFSDPRNCDDGSACTKMSYCDSNLGCVHVPLCPPNGSVCNPADHCGRLRFPPFTVGCFPTLPPDCDDSNACTIDSCMDPGGCHHDPVNCDDGDPCTADGCDPATGCTHTPIASCCTTAADCLVDKCHARICQATVCTGDPLLISCDDGDPSTIDACDPALGCTHAPRPSTTTSTSLPAGGCRVDGDCPTPDDACAVAACSNGTCGSRPAVGFDALACICRRADPAACAQAALPHRVTARRRRACVFIGKAATSSTKSAKFATRAARFLAQAGKALAAAKHVSPACVQALGAQLADDQARADQVGRH